MDRKEKLKWITEELVRMPSVTESARESEPAFWIRDRLEKLDYFRKNPAHLRLIETPLEGSPEKLFALVARVDAKVKTNRAVLLISHFDVVDVHVYGELAGSAFDPDELALRLGSAGVDELYGRGSMDMKCGVALEIDILEEFAENRELFDVNIVTAFVGDEENSSAGMRGVLPALAAMVEEGLDFLSAVNTEPGEAGLTGSIGPMVYLGALGKLMPSFYIKGRAAHVGNCFQGYSAALAAAKLVSAVEGDPSLAGTLDGVAYPSWICLDMGVIKDGYSVTVPDRAYAYFNCFMTTDTPADILEEMKRLAQGALEATTARHEMSSESLALIGYDGERFAAPEPKVFTLAELNGMALNSYGKGCSDKLASFVQSLPPGDMRSRGIAIVDKLTELSGQEGPCIVCFFLPPWLPMRTNFTSSARDLAVIEAARHVRKELYDTWGMEMTEVGLFAGLCDLSYVGGKVTEEDLAALTHNMPGFGEIYRLPLTEMQSLGLPVVNLGPSGLDAHKKTERLHMRYSLEVLPDLLRSLIRQLSCLVR